MQKIININFQGTVIPIEEEAYNNLKIYVDSLRSHFAAEESSDEIINDIENRIAELFNAQLKRGAACINNNDVSAVIDSIGRLEDIEAADGEENKNPKSTFTPPESMPVSKGRFFRNADDKVIAGVCSGIANRIGIDPIIVRVLFVLLFGALFWIYVLLWIIVPSQSISSSITRRLYRNPDDKVIAGVCGGLAVYFRTDSWVPRIIFALPFILSILSGSIHALWWPWGIGPRIFAGSLSSTLFIIYIILWIALPYASSATDKLEMRGEKIDINSIKAATQANAGASATRVHNNGIGRVIGILFKAFFLLIAGIFALSLFGVLIGLVFTGFAAIPFTDFLFDGSGQNLLAWSGLILFLGIPLLALITWIVRRLTGARSHRHYLGYVFAGLWLTGLVSILALAGIMIRNFSSRSIVESACPIRQPAIGKLYVNIGNNVGLIAHSHGRWFGNWHDEDDRPFQLVSRDSLWLNTVKIRVGQSADSLYHIYETKISRGTTAADAKELAAHISFNISQDDSIISLPRGFAVSNKDKFRNQQVMVIIEVPVGKQIQFSKAINSYTWFNVKINGQRNYPDNGDWDNNYYNYHNNTKYLMTPAGLKNTQDTTDTDGEDDEDDDND